MVMELNESLKPVVCQAFFPVTHSFSEVRGPIRDMKWQMFPEPHSPSGWGLGETQAAAEDAAGASVFLRPLGWVLLRGSGDC